VEALPASKSNEPPAGKISAWEFSAKGHQVIAAEQTILQPEPDAASIPGICHARGENDGLPAQWLLYITVADVEKSLKECRKSTGRVLVKRRFLGEGTVAVIRDPAGAVAALFQPEA